MSTPSLSKSLLNNYRQCPRRLWLEVRDRQAVRAGGQPLVQASYGAETLKRFAEGHVVGRIAQAMWPQGIDIERQSLVEDERTGGLRRDLRYAQQLTKNWVLQPQQAIYEATFSHDGLLVQADVLVPHRQGRRTGWQMLEVKSSTAPKDYHLTDLATQAWVARQSGLDLQAVGLVVVSKGFELRQAGNYTGLLKVHDDADLQAQVKEAMQTLPDTLHAARLLLAQPKEPIRIAPGEQCNKPFACPYQSHCIGSEASHAGQGGAMPIRFYNDKGAAKAQTLLDEGHTDLRRVPEQRIHQLWHASNETHAVNRRLAQAVRTGQPVFDTAGAQKALSRWTWPLQHLDFETISFIAPVWPGTRSGEHLPFQYSAHVQATSGKVLAHHEFLDTTGQDPRRALAEHLVRDLSPGSTIVAWNASFERTVIRDLAERFADLRPKLLRLADAVQDLLPVVRQHYAHPDMVHANGGMFSIKTVLPLLLPGQGYEQLDGVQNGNDAQAAYLRVAAPEAVRRKNGYSEAQRKREVKSMLRYCKKDTEAMVLIVKKIWTLQPHPDSEDSV